MTTVAIGGRRCVHYNERVTSAAKKLLDQALALPPEDREQLVGALGLTLPAKEREELVDTLSQSLESVQLSPAWQAELHRRIERIQDGTAVLRDVNDVLAELRTKYE